MSDDQFQRVSALLNIECEKQKWPFRQLKSTEMPDNPTIASGICIGVSPQNLHVFYDESRECVSLPNGQNYFFEHSSPESIVKAIMDAVLMSTT